MRHVVCMVVPWIARSFAALAVPALAGCAAIGLAATEALVTAGAAGTVAIAAGARPNASRVEVYGNFDDERGYWFDPELYGVWVVSDAPARSEQQARARASDACARRGKVLRVMWQNARQERALFIPVRLDRFSFEMRFRCVAEAARERRPPLLRARSGASDQAATV